MKGITIVLRPDHQVPMVGQHDVCQQTHGRTLPSLMSAAEQELLSAFDGHAVQSVRAALEGGADPCSPICDNNQRVP
jgi:hypothetical protein